MKKSIHLSLQNIYLYCAWNILLITKLQYPQQIMEIIIIRGSFTLHDEAHY